VTEVYESEKTLERQIRAFHWVRMLAELPGRFAGSAEEREAAGRIEGWLREIGFAEVSQTPVASRPRPGAVLALHLGVAAFACWWSGLLGAALGVLAWASFRRDQRDGRMLLSRLLPAEPSCNVVARAGAARPKRRVVFSAHIDTAQAGWLFSPTVADFFASRSRATGDESPPPGPNALPEALLLANALLLGAVWLGAEGFLVGTARWLLGLGLVVGAALTVQWARAVPSPGANDNASAVAAMLTSAEQLLAQLPEDVELWVVGTGAEEVGLCGMREFVDAHPDWPRERSYFVNFECVGGGALHWVRTEGTLAKSGYPPQLLELARRIAESDAYGDVTGTDLLASTDARIPASRGFATLSLISLEENGVPRNYHRPEDVPEALDMTLVIRAADFGTAVAKAALDGEAGPLALV